MRMQPKKQAIPGVGVLLCLVVLTPVSAMAAEMKTGVAKAVITPNEPLVLKDAFRHNMPIIVFGYMGEHNLYITTRELVREKVYQGIVIQIQYASPVGWAPEVEDEMVNRVCNVVKSVMGEPAMK